MKEREEGNKNLLLGMVSHVLSFTISEFCKYGYLLAFEKELSDLKGLVKADSIYENDFEILAGIQDPVVRLLLNSVHRVVDSIKIFQMINGLDDIEVMLNEECNQEASNNFHYYINESVGTDFASLIIEAHDFYFSAMHLIFHTAYQLRLQQIDLPDEVFDTFYFDFLDVLDGNFIPEDKNVRLLYDLITAINEDALALEQLN